MHAVLVAGATGYIGRALVAELARRGHAVTALCRHGSTPATNSGDAPGVEWLEADVCDAATLAIVLKGRRFDHLYSTLASRTGTAADATRVDLGANRSLLALAPELGVEHFVLLSAICVQRPTLAFQRAKLTFEAELAASGLRHSIVRPTAFFKSLAGQVPRVRSGKPFLVFGDGTATACKPISERDLAVFLSNCPEHAACFDAILPIGGPGPAITPREQGELLCRLAGRPPRIRAVPVAIFDVAGLLLRPLGHLSRRLADKAELARIGRYYATESMLLWDAEAHRYDADATPETGSDTLTAFYERVLHEGLDGQELGAAAVFRDT